MCNDSVTATLAASLAGLLLFIPAVFQPLLTLNALGIKDSGSLFESFFSFYQHGYSLVAIIVLLTAIIFPLVRLSLLFTVSFMLRLGRWTASLPYMLRTVHHLNEWAMVDVYLIGILVTLIKIHSMAEIHYDSGFFCFVGLMLTMVSASAFLDEAGFWDRIDRLRPQGTGGDDAGKQKGSGLDSGAKPGMTAAEAGYMLCHDCHKLTRIAAAIQGKEEPHCSRCNAVLHARTPESIARTWALLFTAILLLFPANLLPIMRVDSLGVVEDSTIMDGIIYFFHHGSWFIGLIILTASILVPLFKVVGMILILLSVHFNWRQWLRHKAVIFRFIEFIGRWSMLDIFVIALMQVLISFGTLSRIIAAPAATYFGLAVVATMLAAISFDSRLLWDKR